MERNVRMLLGMAGVLLAAGCRTATKVTEFPRVDLELSGGNRGYLVGAPPEAAPTKTTRQMVETTVEVPSRYKPKQLGGPTSMSPEELTPDMEADAGPSLPPAPGSYDTYVVKKGDSLWSIAAKPEVYGKASRWREVFDANRDLLKNSPDRVRPGMTLKIPRGGKEDSGNEGVSYRK